MIYVENLTEPTKGIRISEFSKVTIKYKNLCYFSKLAANSKKLKF